MEKRLTILSSEEMNEFANPAKANNGGGYHQPKYVFEYDGIEGVYMDTSCGDFGSRYQLIYNDKYAGWGSMYDEPSSTFNKDEDFDFLMAFMNEFGFRHIPCENDEYVERI